NPTYCIHEVAEHAMALVLALWRKISTHDRAVRAGEWDLLRAKPVRRLHGATLGLVGFGRIARSVAGCAEGFGLRILFADPHVEEGTDGAPGRRVSLEELAGSSDIISVHVPLNAQTRGM